MSQADLQSKLDELVKQIESAETGSAASSGKWVQVVHTGTDILSMYSAASYQKCFPALFPYGDGVYGLPRDSPLTYREWASYLLMRVELEYGDSFQPPHIPRWQSELNFVAVISDSWKRMELVRLASAHVRRKKFKDSLRVVLDCTSAKLAQALRQLGDNATIGDVMRSQKADHPVRDAIGQLLFFPLKLSAPTVRDNSCGTSKTELCSCVLDYSCCCSVTQLRCSKESFVRFAARSECKNDVVAVAQYGGIQGFLTPNVADTRSPLIVMLHNGCVSAEHGGFVVFFLQKRQRPSSCSGLGKRRRFCIVSSCAGTARLQFEPIPFANDIVLNAQPYTAKWQEEDRFDGGKEEDAKDSEKRRALIAVIPPVLDRHIRKHRAEETVNSLDDTKKKVNTKYLPLTGSVMSRLPHYRLPVDGFDGCDCALCKAAKEAKEQRARSSTQMQEVDQLRSDYIAAFCTGLHEVCALSGHLHEHKNTCFKHAPEGSRKKPQHCRFHFTHFVKLWREKQLDDGNSKLVEVVVARTGKDPVLPIWPHEGCRLSVDTSQNALALDGKHFAGRVSFGAQVETNQDGTQKGRIKTAAMVAHRRNLNYQDCRRALTAGFEPGEVDLLREVGSAASEAISIGAEAGAANFLADTSFVLGSEMDANKGHVRFRVKITSAFILVAEFWKILDMAWGGSLEVNDRAQRKAAEFLALYFDGKMCLRLSRACSSLYHLEFDRRGAADANRVGDRFLTSEQKFFHGYIKETVVEGIRTGIQTGFYTCDYTTKPSLTCGPILKHLTHGMQQLEERMQAEAEQEEARRLHMSYPLPALQEGRGLTSEQREARRRLCRLWTSANHAVMHGFCLMSLQILTGREVLRAHIYWRIMMKRVLWGVFGEMRRNTEKFEDAIEIENAVAVTDIDLQSTATDTRATSFYEDYLHRGHVEPLASMNLYVYAMHVSVMAEWKATEAHIQTLADRADVTCCEIARSSQVVDVTSLRQYRIPGTVQECDAMTFLLDMFLGEQRPKTRRAWKRGRKKQMVVSEIPKLSERVSGICFDYVGHVVNDAGETVLIGNNKEHFDNCARNEPELSSSKKCCYGWHNEQLTAAEYVASISREISANLDSMAEARRRPRPGVLHPAATDEKEDVGLRGEFVDVEDIDDVQNPETDDLEGGPLNLRPDIQYKPILNVAAADLFNVVHRRDVGSGRASASSKRSTEFLKQYGAKYSEMRERWLYVALAFLDEISLTSPSLLAVLNDAAHWGRQPFLNSDSSGSVPEIGKRRSKKEERAGSAIGLLERLNADTLGNVLCQILAGDFLQLNPVLSHSLMEVLGVEVPRAPTYERMEEQTRQRKQSIDRMGLEIFKQFLPQTSLFRGSHRFKAGDPLAELLGNMRKEPSSIVTCYERFDPEANL
eukprot:s119_g11.t1